MTWLSEFAEEAKRSDRLREHPDHLRLLVSGMFGEAGSILAELKKMQREAEAYPHYRQRLTEELGDFLWYFVRLASEVGRGLVADLEAQSRSAPAANEAALALALQFATAVGEAVRCLEEGESSSLEPILTTIWNRYLSIVGSAKLDPASIAAANVAKTQNRWPTERVWHPLFDAECRPEEQLPRTVSLAFLERRLKNRVEVIVRYQGINVGDRLTDNIADPDGYRYHDVFHIAHAVFLGWSPIVRSLLRCKRKSLPEIDENEDGARAAIIEEAVAAVVFSRAKRMNYFEGARQVDYDLLKSVREFVAGYEVDRVPVWQWEAAVLEGFRVFRQMISARGGVVSWSIEEHRLEWSPIGS